MENKTKQFEFTEDEAVLLGVALDCLKEKYLDNLTFSLTISDNDDNIDYWRKWISKTVALNHKLGFLFNK